MPNIEIRTEAANAELNALEKRINELSGRTIKITVDTKGLDKINKELIRVTEATAKQTNAQARQIKAENELAVQQEKTKQETEKRARAEAQLSKQTGETIEKTEELKKSTFSLSNQIMSFLVNQALNKTVAAFKEAVTEMKNVDAEMTAIQMSTGKTAGELNSFRDSAYETASALGTTASDYLKIVSDFSDAGYTEQADALGKLAVVAARVGNTTQDVANQYLIAVDRAYQYDGNVRKLTASIDGANAISNEYATNMNKIAEGIAEVGPVSSKAHAGIDEVTAALGTMTAVTQESGAEAGEALKSAFLGIMGDTQTEIKDGITWTAGELSGLTDIIREYAPEAYGAAEATNSMLDPMTVIGELAESVKSGFVSEQELMSAFAGLGDKLDTSQLMALIENWDMYENMLGTYAVSTGSSAREYEVYLDSWEAKTSQLSASWTEFISNLIETDTVKTILDGLTAVIELLDTDIGRSAITVVTLTAALSGLVKVFPLIKKGIESIKGVTLSPQVIAIAAAVTALYVAYTSFKKINDELQAQEESHKETLHNLNAEYEKQFGNGSEYDRLKSKVGELSEEEQKHLDILERQNEALKTKIRLGMQDDYEKITKENEGTKDSYGGLTKTESTWQAGIGYRDIKVTQTVSEAVSDLRNELDEGNMSLTDFRTGLQDIADTARDDYDTLINWKNAGGELTDSQENFINSYEDLIVQMDVFNGLCDSQGNLLTAEEAAVKSATLDVIDLMNAQYGLAISYDTTTEELLKLLSAQEKMAFSMALQYGIPVEERKEWLNKSRDIKKIREGLEADIEAASKLGGKTKVNIGDGGNGGGGGGTKAAKSTRDEQLEALKDTISLRKSELDLIEAQSGSVGSQLAKMREIQAALHAQHEHMEANNGSMEEMNKLSSEWWQWQDKIVKLQKELQSELESAVSDLLKEAEDARDIELKRLDNEIEAEKKKTEEKQKQVDLQEKEKSVAEARIALENAQSQRNVRFFNAETGQWEWTYNANDVESAKKTLEDAENDLSDYKKEIASNAVIEALEEQKKQVNAEYDAIKDSWSVITKSLQEPARSITKILSDIAENGTPEMKKQIEGVSKMLGDLGGFIGKYTNTSYEESTQTAAAVTSSGSKTKAHIAKKDGTSDAKVGEIAITGGGVYLKTEAGKPGVKVGTLENLIGKKTTKDPKEVEKAFKKYQETGVYDSGGVLHGIGGIKATFEDEMVLPPDLTRSLLSPTADSTFRRRLAEMNYMYGSAERAVLPAGVSTSTVGSQHYGDVYKYGSITLTSDRAKSLTVYELAQMSRTLSLYSNAN